MKYEVQFIVQCVCHFTYVHEETLKFLSNILQ